MSTHRNKAKLRRLLEEGMNGNDLGTIRELVADDYRNHDFPLPLRGAEGFTQIVGIFRAGFPDLRVSIEGDFGEGDLVGTRGTITGTHRGDFMGIPPTGKPVTIGYLDLWRISDGTFRETWVQMDMLGLMQQLGVVPAPQLA